MVQKRETKAINKLCVREILSLSFVCGAYFFEFRGRNLVCFVIAYNFNGKYAPFSSPEPPFLLVTWSTKRRALVAAITGCP